MRYAQVRLGEGGSLLVPPCLAAKRANHDQQLLLWYLPPQEEDKAPAAPSTFHCLDLCPLEEPGHCSKRGCTHGLPAGMHALLCLQQGSYSRN